MEGLNAVEPDDFVTQVVGVGSLAEPVRRDLYRYVVAQPRPVSRDEAAEGVGLPRHTAKFHLDRLVEQGLLEAEFKRLTGRAGPGAGRPAKLYRRSARELSVTVPERAYDVAGMLMAQAIEESARGGAPVVEVLHRAAAERGAMLGQDARHRAGPAPTKEQLLETVAETMAGNGYEPRLHSGAITLANCPFHKLAREHTELVCGMNLVLLQSLVSELGHTGLSARLEPAPNRCCVIIAS